MNQGGNRRDRGMNRQPSNSRGTGNRRVLSQREIALYRARRRQKEKEQTIVMLLLCGIAVMLVLLTVVILWDVTDKNETPADIVTGSGETGSGETGSAAKDTTDSSITDTPISPSIPAVDFTADLSAYEAYMNPQGDDRDAYLLLVNAQNPLTERDVPADLTDVSATRKDGRKTQKMRNCAAMALEALFKEADALGYLNNSTGYQLSVTSAYRSYSEQSSLFNTYVAQEMQANPSLTLAQAEAIVARYSNRPGTSEHQSGLCADLHNQVAASSAYPEVFANTPEGKWVHENCWKFGFVLRFPDGKTDITGIKYESWHFRYVGRYHAWQMTEMGMCLEEYVEYLERNA